ncbi:uncharacterized protein [Nicotiana tomentosiformis]|uniref:uncharacterized protein n=1 Tax=Nicotiana tomentosiformis TaxID=4098 RepID=UPI00388C6F4B
MIIKSFKKRLEAAKGKWPEELPGVLWAYRSKAKSSTGEIPFSLVDGAEALISVEVGEPTLRYFLADEEANNEALLVKLDLLDERRDLAHIRMVAQKQRMERYYNRRANLRYFKVGDLVLRKVTQNTREINAGKLGPTWKDPYRVSVITGKGSYELENQDGVKLPSNWNVLNEDGKHTTKEMSSVEIRPLNDKALKQKTTAGWLNSLWLNGKFLMGSKSCHRTKGYSTVHKCFSLNKPLGGG